MRFFRVTGANIANAFLPCYRGKFRHCVAYIAGANIATALLMSQGQISPLRCFSVTGGNIATVLLMLQGEISRFHSFCFRGKYHHSVCFLPGFRKHNDDDNNNNNNNRYIYISLLLSYKCNYRHSVVSVSGASINSVASACSRAIPISIQSARLRKNSNSENKEEPWMHKRWHVKERAERLNHSTRAVRQDTHLCLNDSETADTL